MTSMKNRKKRKSIRKKLLASTIIMAFLICAASCLVGYLQYNNTIMQLYNDNGYVIGEIILDHIDHDKVAEYAETWQEDEYYTEMETYLDRVLEASDAAYIYIAIPNGTDDYGNNTMRYIYDCTGCKIGDVDPVPMYYDSLVYTYETGLKTGNFYVRHSPKYGDLTGTMLPIIDSNGKTAAILFVDIFMTLIRSTMIEYIVKVVLISLFLLAVFCVFYWHFMNGAVIEPVRIISKNAEEFAQNATISSSLEEIKTNDEVQDLAESVSSMEHSIVEYIQNIQTVTAEKERIGAELNVATHIQSSMLPCIFPAFPDHDEFDIYATMDPAKEVGGDFYDFFMVDETHIAIVIADVSGKGVPAALFMVIAKTLIKDHTYPSDDLGTVFTKVNDLLCQSNSEGLFVTAFEGVLDLATGEFRFVNAGHEMPFICKAGGQFAPYKIKPGFVLAGFEGMKYRSGMLQLDPGDKIFEYTDGVTEAMNEEEQLYGMERLEAVLKANSDKSPTDLLPAVKADMDQFVGSASQFDDITMLCLEYKQKI